MVIFSLFLFVAMLMVGGLAVDLMRFENERTALQNTTDRAVLAAASLRQERVPEDVVEDYFAKEGLTKDLKDVDVVASLNSKIVTVDAEAKVPTFFMHMLDINTLQAPSVARAEESVGNIEISLVLDISGSMREGDQIGKLRVAAKNFFNTVLDGKAAETTSINVVPYAGHVNVGPSLMTRYGVTRKHTDSSCIDLATDDYKFMDEPPQGRGHVPHFMNWAIHNGTMNWGWCPADVNQIRIAQNDLASLTAFVDGIRLHDGTATHTGTKYGLMLLNPAMRSTFATLAGTRVPSQFSDRPMTMPNAADANVKKYLIVMTDGAITEQVRPLHIGYLPNAEGQREDKAVHIAAGRPRDDDDDDDDDDDLSESQWKADNANVNLNRQDNLDDELYYVRTDTAKNGVKTDIYVKDPDTVDGTDHALWNKTVELANQPSVNRGPNLTSASANVTSFLKQCDLAKAQGILVYTIAFNAGSGAETEMRKCASGTNGEGYFYAVKGNGIISAFNVIARDIRQLKLTQ